MAMLAESRSRQKWSDDPRNTRWANDKSKFGYQMLTRMGWSEGKGLGQNESGQTSHVKVKKRKGNSGIGSKHSHDDDWISHQNDFNDLLSALNQGSTSNDNNSIKSLEDRVKSSRKKILYTKFVKSKDLSNASSQDLACIFGTRSKSAPATPNLSDDDEEEEGSTSDASAASCPTYTAALTNPKTEHGFTTVNTGVSVADYFAKKMAALKKNNAKEVHNGDLEQNTLKKKIENKKTEMLNIDGTDINENPHNIVAKRKKKKKRKMDSDIEFDNDKNVPEDPDYPDDPDDLKPKKKKKRKTVEDDIDVKTINNEDHDSHEKKKKKKKKEKKKRADEKT